MISLVRGPGGLVRRLADDFVPLLLALAVGGVAITFLGPLSAALLAGLAWPAASIVLRAVRRRPVLRRVYRVAAWGHVIFWSVLGFRAGEVVPASAPEVVSRSAWTQPAPARSGYGEAAFALPDWAPLAGWGARPRRVRMPAFGGIGPLGRHAQAFMAAPDADGRPRLPLFRPADADGPEGPLQQVGARVLVLEPTGGAGRLVVVRLDLVTTSRRLHEALLARFAADGVTAERLLVAATHTHSGPGGYSENPVAALFGTDHHSPAMEAAIVDAAARAYGAAVAGMVPVRVGVARARDRDPDTGQPVLARNRRGAEDAIDDRVYALRIDAADGSGTIAVVLNYAVHPYFYRRRHMHFERDLAGGLEEALRARLVGRPGVLFINGAQGDVSTRASSGTPAERIDTLAKRFADVIAPAIEQAMLQDVLRVASARVERQLATPRAFVTAVGRREGVVDALDRPLTEMQFASTTADALALPFNVVLWSLALPEARVGFSWEGDVGARIGLAPAMGRPAEAFTAWVFALGPDGNERVALLAQPGEAMHSLGRAWRALAAERGVPDALVVGLCNGALAYVTPSADFAKEGYEYDSTLFGPTMGDDVTDALLVALDAALEDLGP